MTIQGDLGYKRGLKKGSLIYRTYGIACLYVFRHLNPWLHGTSIEAIWDWSIRNRSFFSGFSIRLNPPWITIGTPPNRYTLKLLLIYHKLSLQTIKTIIFVNSIFKTWIYIIIYQFYHWNINLYMKISI